MKAVYFLLAAAAAVTAQTECEAHDDHWHCPSGVPEPTYLPGQEPAITDTTSAPASTPPNPSPLSTPDHNISLTASGVCEAHDDHWHCPSGVPEPTTPPPALTPSATPTPLDHTDDDDHAATATTCEPHDDHWYCPSGVAEPTTLPAPTTTAANAGEASGSATSPSASSFTGAAVGGALGGGVFAVLLGAVGALVV